MQKNVFCTLMLSILYFVQPVHAEVVAKGNTGFQIKIEHTIEANEKQLFATLMDIAKWWSSDHTYSGDASNLSLSLKEKCFLETLPNGGFVRHLELVNYQPGKMLVLSGGLGPLQPMGVHGALTISSQVNESKTGCRLTAMYNVSGFAEAGLENLAPVVEGVLAQQFAKLKKVVESQNP